MPEGFPEYPPQFGSSFVTRFRSETSALAGTDNSDKRSFKAKTTAGSEDAERLLSGLAAGEEGIPVFITGSRDTRASRPFPGLKEVMTAAAIYRLAEDLGDDVREKQEIQELALRLQKAGAEKLLQAGPTGASMSGATSQKKKSKRG